MGKELARKLEQLVDASSIALASLSSDDTAVRPAPDRWSKREILGHLIDSASNNHQRFVRAQQCERLEFPSYDQVAWVACQHYADREWEDLLTLWIAYNRHLVHVLNVMPPAVMQTQCRVVWNGESQDLPLVTVATQYLEHMRHHLAQLSVAGV